MVEKVFRIFSNSKEYLSADVIAMALLRQVTLNPNEPNVYFGVAEVISQEEDVAKQYSNSNSLELEGEVS